MLQKVIIAFGVFITYNSTPVHLPSIPYTHQEIPAYAKWGQLAMQETQSKYPNASIIDYLHEGKESKENSTIEKFRLWLRESDKEFGVSVKIEYITDTDELVNIQIQEI